MFTTTQWKCRKIMNLIESEMPKCLSGQMFYNAGVLSDAWVEIIAGSPGINGKFPTKNEAKRAESGSHFVTKTSDKED